MEEIVQENQRKAGEMFTSSFLKNATPFYQFLFVTVIGLLLGLIAKFIFHSGDLVFYAALFGIVFYVMFNPWLCLLATNNKQYILFSWLFFGLITLIMFGMLYLLTGMHPGNTWGVSVILVSNLIYMVVTYGMMLALKLLFLDVSGGGM